MISVSNNFLFTIALDCLQGYNFLEPFSIYLKKYFQSNHKLGSRDRRNIRQLCYAWLRLGNAGKQLSDNERLYLALFLCYHQLDAFSERIFKDADFKDALCLSSKEKWNLIQKVSPGILNKSDLFPFQNDFMSDINTDDFLMDGFNRRGLWVRIKRNYKSKVISYFQSNNILFEINNDYPLAISLKDDFDIINSDPYKLGWLEIQDLSSQILGSSYYPSDGGKWLDACAASGGKSLQLLDVNNTVELTVSDIRESILTNLQVRFKRNHVRSNQSLVVDWSNPDLVMLESLKNKFDAIIADVPCSGSGTWARTPEQKQIITEEKLQKFSELQFSIVGNLIPTLKTGGKLYYSTCSVYQTENSSVVNRLLNCFPLELVRSKTINGVGHQADTMYFAELIKK